MSCRTCKRLGDRRPYFSPTYRTPAVCRSQNGGEVVLGRFPSRAAALASIGR